MKIYISYMNQQRYSGGMAVILAKSVEQAFDLIEPERHDQEYFYPRWTEPKLTLDLGLKYNSDRTPRVLYSAGYAE